ncbi:MAG: hypothetical protein AAGB19_22295 [Cyanobacteria bacterium P01_F01_bin.3]
MSRAIAYEDITPDIAVNPSHSPRRPVQEPQVNVSSASWKAGIRAVTFDQTLCRVYASRRNCAYGTECKRFHMSAAEFMRHPNFELQNQREHFLIEEIDRLGGIP